MENLVRCNFVILIPMTKMNKINCKVKHLVNILFTSFAGRVTRKFSIET